MKLRTIFWFWLPLAFSWLLMTFEGPWIQGVMSRKPEAALQLAAFGLVMSLSVLIEAPVIMFLAVGSALARDKQSYAVLYRYTMVTNVLITVIAALMAFTPLLDLYLGTLLGIPENIIEATRPAMVIMIFWSGFIGYRRFHQGILIRHGRTRNITVGTVWRIIVSAGFAVALGLWSNLAGAVIAAISMMASATVEMLYIHIISRQDIEKLNSKPLSRDKEPLTYRHIFRFHLPLALTSIMTLLVLPMLQSGLASADNAEEALAAFPVIFSILLIMRSGGLAWQEVVITLSKGAEQVRALRRFTILLGFGTSGMMILFTATPLIQVYTRTILDVPENLISMIVIGTVFAVLVPLFTATQSYLRAMLMRVDNTSPIYQGMGLGFIATALTLWGGLWLGIAAIPTASIALSTGVGLELFYLWRASRGVDAALNEVLRVALATGD